MSSIHVSPNSIQATIRILAEAGRLSKECIVLWLGARNGEAETVSMVYHPAQVAESDQFTIPQQSMRQLMSVLADNELKIVAQVHSHPFEAFHSLADDRLAIIRHAGAISIVLPYFALHTTPSSFLIDAKVFLLDPANVWNEIEPTKVTYWVKVDE